MLADGHPLDLRYSCPVAGHRQGDLTLGAKSWFFLSADYSLGVQLEADSRRVIEATGGNVVGAVKHPVNTPDFSSFLLQAQSSKADVIALADAGGDFINAVKQAAEFGITHQQKLAGLIVFIADIHSLGLPSAKGLMLSSAFYWDLNGETREWSKRFVDKTQKVPTMIHAGTYGAVAHYLRAVEAAGTLDGPTVAARMREMPVNDFMTSNGRIREDGRLIRGMYLFASSRRKSRNTGSTTTSYSRPFPGKKRSGRWRKEDARS